MTDQPRTRRRTARWRTSLVVLPLVAGLLVAAGLGAQMLLAEVPDPQASSAPVTCWDGEQETDGADCGLPTGPSGLHWVFPSFSPGDEGCRDVLAERADLDRPTMWRCETEVAGSPVVITYNELTGVKAGRAYVEQRYDGVQRTLVRADNGDPARFEWRRQLPDGGFELTAMYVAYPYSVEVRAEGRAIRESAFEGIVRFRSTALVSYR